jgi:hypothetical protein
MTPLAADPPRAKRHHGPHPASSKNPGDRQSRPYPRGGADIGLGVTNHAAHLAGTADPAPFMDKGPFSKDRSGASFPCPPRSVCHSASAPQRSARSARFPARVVRAASSRIFGSVGYASSASLARSTSSEDRAASTSRNIQVQSTWLAGSAMGRSGMDAGLSVRKISARFTRVDLLRTSELAFSRPEPDLHVSAR